MKNGFSLIELLITLAVIGILAAIAMPLYSQHLIKEKRLDAIATLSRLSLALEEYFITNHSYQGASLERLGFDETIASSHYKLAIQFIAENDFELHAIPLGEQMEKDQLCGTLTLNSNGARKISGSAKLEDCW